MQPRKSSFVSPQSQPEPQHYEPRPKPVAGTPNDPLLKFARLTIDDDPEYLLCYSFNAIAQVESMAGGGVNLLHGLDNLTDLTAVEFRGLLYAALLTAHPDMTLEDAGSLIRLDTMQSVIEALKDAYILSIKKKPPVTEPKILTETVPETTES